MAHAAQGGLQKHSVGATYPMMVVGTMQGGKTRYYVQNAVNGQNFYRSDGEYYNTSASAQGRAQFEHDELQGVTA